MDILKQFGKRVQILRVQAGWSQEYLADLAGLHRTYMSGIERGVRNPSLLIVERIANALSISPSELLKVEG
jgi:transcriptional regulator with XRE-family HTH domain